MLQLLIFATVWNGESQTKLSAPGLYFGQEDVHFAGIKIGGMPGFPVVVFSPVMKSVYVTSSQPR